MGRRSEKEVYAARKEQGLCVKCGNSPKSSTSLNCEACTEKRKIRYKTRVESGLCTCGSKLEGSTVCLDCAKKRNQCNYKKRDSYLKSGFCRCGRDKKSGRKTCDVCNDRVKAHSAIVKDEVFQNYGGYICRCCGETEKVFLSIDHINNDGAEHRRKLYGRNGSGGSRFYKWLRKHSFPEGFQVLCFNCNHAKRFGVCPHQLRGS